MESQNIYSRLEQIAPEVFDKTPVLFAYLFGSHARGIAHGFSDLDIAVYIDTTAIKDTYRLEMNLCMAFDARLNHEFASDVRTLNTLPVEVVGEVLTFGRLIYSIDEAARVDFETLARKRYFDFKPVLDEYRRHLIQGIR